MKLAQTLEAAGKPTHVCRNPDGSRVLVLPHGGRVLGLFAPGSDENFFWTHPAMETVASAQSFFDGDQWHNSGGDRTWLAPEADIFFPEFPSLKTYFQPRQLDPGAYQVIETGGPLQLLNRLRIALSRSKCQLDLEMTKSVAPAANPLRYERECASLNGIQFAGYTLETTLEVLGETEGEPAAVGLWNLVQMPHGGDLLVPTYGRTTPKICFGNIAPEDLVADEHLLIYRMRAAGEHKIDIRATATTGRIGYLYQTPAGRWALIVRNFFVDPSGEYVDPPWNDVEDLGYAAQACNVNSNLGSFSELEYHVPAIGRGTGHAKSRDVSRLWAFRGDEAQIRRVANILLGVN